MAEAESYDVLTTPCLVLQTRIFRLVEKEAQNVSLEGSRADIGQRAIFDSLFLHNSHAEWSCSLGAELSVCDREGLSDISEPLKYENVKGIEPLMFKETDTQVIDVQSSNPTLVSEWKRRLSDDVDIITTLIRPDSNRAGDGGLGISLEGWWLIPFLLFYFIPSICFGTIICFELTS